MWRAAKKQDLAPVIRTAFWSGTLPEKKWRQAMQGSPAAHKLIVKTSFAQMPSTALIAELGEKRFLKVWPEIRKLFDPGDAKDRQRLLLFDSAWGILATGDSQYPVSEQVAALSKGRLALLREIVNSPGLSIYNLAKKTARSYSRVFKEVKLLADYGLVAVEEDKVGNRKVGKLYARESINTKLARAMQSR